jgi:Protein of unknown function (DUF2911)
MKSIIAFVAILLIAAFAIAQDLPRPSPKASLMQAVGLTDVTITYSRPSVKGRVIWGELVPYDKVWRTGANEATTINFSDDVKINGQSLPAGIYSLHSIPGKDMWTLIFNKDADQWGSYKYDQAKDVLRIQVKPQENALQELLTFAFPVVQADKATVTLSWEKVQIPFTIETNTMTKAAANIKKAIDDMTNWRTPYNAANYAFTFNTDNKAEANQWIDKSISLKETYWNLRLKAAMLARDGNKKEAISLAEKAVQLGKQNQDEPTEVAKTEKQIADWKSSK